MDDTLWACRSRKKLGIDAVQFTTAEKLIDDLPEARRAV